MVPSAISAAMSAAKGIAMAEQWISDDCPGCGKTNFVNNGDPLDMTAMDVEGIECWKCGHKWKIDDGESAYLGEPCYEVGQDLQVVPHKRHKWED